MMNEENINNCKIAEQRWKNEIRQSKNKRRRELYAHRREERRKELLLEHHKVKTITKCGYCDAKKFEHEPPTFCCYNGEVLLKINPVYEEMYRLYTFDCEESREFRNSIRGYNSVFAFTSLGVKLDKTLANMKSGNYTFRVQGQVHHYLPTLTPTDNTAKYLQLYFYDTENEVSNRVSHIPTLSTSTVQKLMSLLNINPYSIFLRSLRSLSSLENKIITIRKDCGLDQRVYNAPTANQVAAIWVEGNTVETRYMTDIIVHGLDGKTHKIQPYYGCYDPLQYPLLFPRGEMGWHRGIKRNKRGTTLQSSSSILPSDHIDFEDILHLEEGLAEHGNDKGYISAREYYAYLLQIRENSTNLLLFGGRLLQQYVVDMYIKIETDRLDFFYRNQSNIRAELYQGVVDAVNAGEANANNIGKRIVLPASFIGGPRDMRRRYLNAMALVHRFGKPDIFLTITCNPEWEDIKAEMQPWENTYNRPDITSRIFRAKLQDLKEKLIKDGIFGKVAAHVYVIEFQKRGLPHAHFLIIMKEEFKINSPDDYDKIVSAEIPDPSIDNELYEMVLKHMMHGPCGNLRPTSPCMKGGRCKSQYPRPFCDKSMRGNNSYPIYRRRNNGQQAKVRNHILDNRWVVPYNPYLLRRYNCHINVEICSSITAVKYLYKYVYKGHDRVSVYIHAEDDKKTIDEIKNYQDGRWVSPPEAMWRIYQFTLNEMYPSVTPLPLHLPNRQMVTFKNNDSLSQVVSEHHIARTMLTEFFTTNGMDVEARKLLYREFPEFYVWNRSKLCWTRRKNKQAIGRINATNPSEGERHILRILLNHVRGPTSFNDLYAVNGATYPTFKDVAQILGLLETDNAVLCCIEEATQYEMPYSLRRLFATVLAFCEPHDVNMLWKRFEKDMCEDFARNEKLTSQEQISATLKDINFFLHNMGRNINQYDLPQISIEQDEIIGKSKELFDELSIQTPPEDVLAITLLNDDQKRAFNHIMSYVNQQKGGIFFIDGPGGTGKTFLYRALLAQIRSTREIALATATCGVAASLLPGGRTAHSRFKIPLDVNQSSICGIKKQSSLAELIRKSKLIIWDEAPMSKKFAIETLDRTFQDLMDSQISFGGKVMLFGGDFRQVLPVVPKGTRKQTIEVSLVRSYLWPQITKLYLKKNMRARDDKEFSDFLLRVGDGIEQTIDRDMICIPKDMLIHCDTVEESENQLIDVIYPELCEQYRHLEYIASRAILSTKNEFVDNLNEMIITKFPGEEHIYYSFDCAVDETNSNYQLEFLNSLTPNGMPPSKLVLKKYCPIILLRNLDPTNGLCNGTRLMCIDLQKNVIKAKIAVGQHSGKEVLLPRIPLYPVEIDKYPFNFRRKQFPIRLAFAMTINKAQGQTIPNVGIYLPEPVFSHGQLYVAMSRGISKHTTKFLVKGTNIYDGKDCRYTRNIVWNEIYDTQHCYSTLE